MFTKNSRKKEYKLFNPYKIKIPERGGGGGMSCNPNEGGLFHAIRFKENSFLGKCW